MDIIIETERGRFDLPDGVSVQVNETNPIYNESGSMSVPMTVPATRNNMRLSGWASELVSAEDINTPRQRCRVSCGSWQRTGLLNYVSAGRTEGITFNVGFDNSEAYAAWKNRTLREVAERVGTREEYADMDELKRFVDGVYMHADIGQAPYVFFPYACFPFAVAVSDGHYDILNEVANGALVWPSTVKRMIDGTLTDVTVPDGYGCTLLARVWYVLDMVFRDSGYALRSNPFESDRRLSRLVVMNNAADCFCTRCINDADFMPDCTVEQFLNALYVRFGLVYTVRDGAAELRFIRDIIEGEPVADLTGYASGYPLVNFGSPRYLKLSAGRSFDGASVTHTRWADLRRGLADRPIYHYGSGSTPVFSSSGVLMHDSETCQWWWSASSSEPGRITSSSFFDWDPMTDGVEADEKKSDDECVGLARVRVGASAGEMGSAFMVLPLYMAGSRHYYTYVKGSDKADDSDADGSTPLSFLLAYTDTSVRSPGTIGRLSGYDLFARPITFTDPTEPPADLSLFFEFKGGLFDLYWRRFDELLRHATRTVEVPLRLPAYVLSGLDMLSVYRFGNLRCLIDKLEYPLGGRVVDVKARLRVIQTQGDYDIAAEQSVADVLPDL